MIVCTGWCYIKLLQVAGILAAVDIIAADIHGSADDGTIWIRPWSKIRISCARPFQTIESRCRTACRSNVIEIVNSRIFRRGTGYCDAGRRCAGHYFLFHAGCQMIRTDSRILCRIEEGIYIRNFFLRSTLIVRVLEGGRGKWCIGKDVFQSCRCLILLLVFQLFKLKYSLNREEVSRIHIIHYRFPGSLYPAGTVKYFPFSGNRIVRSGFF